MKTVKEGRKGFHVGSANGIRLTTNINKHRRRRAIDEVGEISISQIDVIIIAVYKVHVYSAILEHVFCDSLHS